MYILQLMHLPAYLRFLVVMCLSILLTIVLTLQIPQRGLYENLWPTATSLLCSSHPVCCALCLECQELSQESPVQAFLAPLSSSPLGTFRPEGDYWSPLLLCYCLAFPTTQQFLKDLVSGFWEQCLLSVLAKQLHGTQKTYYMFE